jgi:hypothetical protein
VIIRHEELQLSKAADGNFLKALLIREIHRLVGWTGTPMIRKGFILLFEALASGAVFQDLHRHDQVHIVFHSWMNEEKP